MKYDRFEDLPVWKSAIDLAVGIYSLTKQRAFRGPGDLCSQLRRAALSVSNNIAEGFERGTTAELLMFLYIARGSAGEVRSMLNFVERLIEEGRSKSSDLKSQISNLKSLAESCSRQIRAWADKLQNTDIKGQRHLTKNTREAYQFQRRAHQFWEQIDTAMKAGWQQASDGDTSREALQVTQQNKTRHLR